MRLEDLHPLARQRVIDALAAAEHKAGEPARQIIAEKAERGPEKRLQADVEAWLHHHGYWRLSEKDLDAGTPPKGWQFHMPGKAAKGNPLLPDLTLLSLTGRYLWVELKATGGRIAKHQQQLMEQGNCRLAMSVEQVRSIVLDWESQTERMEDDGR